MIKAALTREQKSNVPSADISLRLDWCSPKAARYAAEKWHYSGRLPVGKLVKIGVWENGEFIGCVVFASGASPSLGSPYGLSQFECCELARVALKEHHTPVSRILTIALKMLKQRCQGIKLVVSFADTNHGHHGGIYQASNWIYAGLTNPTPVYYDEHGKAWHNRLVTQSGMSSNIFGKAKRVKRASDLVKVMTKPKHRYLMPLDKEVENQIRLLSKPYPKRVV